MATAPEADRLALEALMQTAQYKSDFFDAIEAQGEAKGEAKILMKILDSRGITLNDEQLAQVRSCTDSDQLELWADRALGATSASDVLKD